MPKTLKILRILLASVLIIELFHLLLLVFPQPFFRHSISYGNFHFYRDQPFSPVHFDLFQEIVDQITQSHLFDAEQHHRIFLCKTPTRYALYSFLAAKNSTSQGFALEPTGNVFVSEAYIDVIRNRYGPAFRHTFLEGSLSHIIKHEIFHSMTTRHLGFWTSRTLPSWKREGYAEYGASKHAKSVDPDFHFMDQIDRLWMQRDISVLRSHYLQSHLLIQYLVEIESMRFDSIMTETVTEANTTRRMFAWKKQAHSSPR